MTLKSPMSKQTSNIYALLLAEGSMSAVQIGQKLRIFPHAVYRSTKQLEAMGCINKTGKHPVLFQAIPIQDSVQTFSMVQRDVFLNTFLDGTLKGNISLQQDLNITFIDSREMMFEKALADIQNVKNEMDNLASGDELPAEIMLAQKEALERGIVIRTLFQKRNEKNESFIKARTRMGEQIRLTQPLNVRMVIFDKRVVYIMSHDPSDYIKSMGIRFEYAPIGQLIYQQFLHYWEKGFAIIDP